MTAKPFLQQIRELEIISEAVNKLSDELTQRYPEVLWNEIKAFRNKIVHEYFGIDYKIVWDVIKNELPILLGQVKAIMEDEAKN